MPIRLESIDGSTPLDGDEIEGLIPSSISTQAQLNAAEQANITEAFVWASDKKHDAVLSESFVRELHKRMFKDVWRWAGTYRKTVKNLGVDPKLISIQIHDLCKDVAHWIKEKTFSWDEIGARFHHRLVSIHPFPNGNGRHSRLMTNILLATNDQPLFTWGAKSSSSDIGAAGEIRERYIAALKVADRNDFSKLIAFARS